MIATPRLLRRTALALALSLSAAMPALAQESINYSYTYWDTSEPGWGYNLTHQGDVLYGTWYTYAGDGKPMFLTVEGRLAGDGSFSGPVYRIAGTPFQLINGTQAFTAVTEVGMATMRFDADGKLQLDYTLDGTPAQTKQLERFSFDPAAPECVGTTESRAAASNYSDLWWNASEPGWGLTLSHQGDIVFVLWYTYGAEGRDQWISGSTLVKQADGSYAGALQRPDTGTPLLQIDGPATSFPVPEVGSASLTFSDGETGSFTYTLDGVTQTRAITRFVAVAADQPKPLCRVKNSGGGGSNPDACYPGELVAGQSRTYRRTDVQTNVSSEEDVVIIGPAVFRGESAVLFEQRLQNGDLNRTYQRIENGDYVFIGEQAVQNGVVVQEGSFSPFLRTPIAPALGDRLTQNYSGTSTANGTTTQIQYQDSIELVRRENVTVPAGTFQNVCVLERELKVTAAGFTTTIDFEIWTNSVHGEIKSIARTQIGGPFPISTEKLSELIRFNLNGVAVPAN